MGRKRRFAAAAGVASGLVALQPGLAGPASAGPAPEPPEPYDPTIADFEGRKIDLSVKGWEGAQACVVIPVAEVSECFTSREEADARFNEVYRSLGLPETPPSPKPGDTAPPGAPQGSTPQELGGPGKSARAIQCVTSLYLYKDAYYSGQTLHFGNGWQGYWANLNNWGFDNVTSSYWNAGSCHALFKDGYNGGGSGYPYNPQENGEYSPYMASGWDNKVSSVYTSGQL